MPGALAGTTVIDLSWGLPGAVVGMLLADHGAEVIRVEPPRNAGRPRFLGERVWDRGKRSAAIDITRPEGAALLRRLLAGADVLIESFAPGAMAGWGLSFDALHAEFPRLVYCSITGYGTSGPDAGRPAHPALVEARTGQVSEQPGYREGPIYLGWPLAAYGAMFLAQVGILAALYVREQTGRGQHVETSLRDGVLGQVSSRWLWGEKVPPRPRTRWTGRAPINRRAIMGLYQCADGEWLYVHTMARGAFNRLLRLMGLSQFARDYDSPQEPGEALPEADAAYLNEHVPAIFASRPRADWLAALDAADIPVLPALPPGECFDDPQVRAMEMVVPVEDPELGTLEQVGLAARLWRTPGAVGRGAPLWAADTRAVLERAGVAAAAIEALARAGVIACREAPAAREGYVSFHQKGTEDTEHHGGAFAARRASVVNSASATRRYALEGVRVIDFGIFLAGPWASKVLADLGAEVIKVEAVEGEPGRSLGPICASVQRGKKCLAVDLKTPEGQAIVHQLVRAADIVHHNLRVGVAERIGMGYEQLRALNPRLIYCHSSGYGTRGPKALYPTFEPLHSAFTGILHENAGEGNPPLMYLSNMDLGSGYLAAAAMLMALIERARSGEGQFIECPQTAAALTCISEVYRHDGVASPAHYLDPAQTGRGPLDRLYETRAGWIALAAEDAWDALLDAIGRPDLARDPRFAAAAARRQHAAALASELEAVFRTRGAAEWAERLDAAGVPAEIAREYQGDAFLHGPANLAAGLVAEYEHLEYGRMREVGQLIRFSETPGVTHNAGPVLGEHTFEILGGLGYTPAEIRRLKEAGVVTWSPLVEPGSPLPLGEG